MVLRELRGGDPRPLLILRECKGCTDQKADELVKASLESERLQVASQWFHCVKVEASVTKKNHAWNSLFAGKSPPHLILASADGTKVLNVLGTATEKMTWDKITTVLSQDYSKDPLRAAKELQKLLNKFDHLDEKAQELKQQLARYEQAADAKKAKAAEDELARCEKEREAVVEEEKKWKDLGLKKGQGT